MNTINYDDDIIFNKEEIENTDLPENKMLEKIIATFSASLQFDTTYTLKELKHVLTCAYDAHNPKTNMKLRPRKDNQTPKAPRKPNEYNIFVKANMPEVNLQYPQLCIQDRMKIIGEMWQKHKDDKAAAARMEKNDE